MLKIDREKGTLHRLKPQSMTESGMKERSDLQELIFRNAEEFFGHECGENLFILAQEVQPSTVVSDRIDLLALDGTEPTLDGTEPTKGFSVIIELKRGSHKLQLLQAISYAAMVADLDWTNDLDKLVDQGRRSALQAFLDDTGLDADDAALNKDQRVILIAESYDYEVLKTAQWLTDHGLYITCYQVALAKDTTNDMEYLSAVQLFPAKSLAAQARLRGAQRSREANQPDTMEKRLRLCTNKAVKSFFKALLEGNPRRNRSGNGIVFPATGTIRLRFRARVTYAIVTQVGRFEGDELKWRELSNPKLRVKPDRLHFRLYNDADIQLFSAFLKQDLTKINWTVGSSTQEEDDDEEEIA